VVEGSDVVDEISKVKTARGDRPMQDVVIESVEITGGDGTGESAG